MFYHRGCFHDKETQMDTKRSQVVWGPPSEKFHFIQHYKTVHHEVIIMGREKPLLFLFQSDSFSFINSKLQWVQFSDAETPGSSCI